MPWAPLGIDISETTVSKYMVRSHKPYTFEQIIKSKLSRSARLQCLAKHLSDFLINGHIVVRYW